MSDIEQRLRGENPEHCVVTDRLRANIGMPDTFQFDRDDAVELDELVLEAADEIARLEADNASLRSKLEEAEGARDRERRRATDAEYMAVAVKPLEWEEKGRSGDYFAKTVVGRYEVGLVHTKFVTMLRAVDSVDADDFELFGGGGLEAAKAAAEADYASRIRSALVATPPAERAVEAAGYAERLAIALWEKHYRNAAPNWKPLTGDLIGILTQIDNMTSGLALATKPAVKDDETVVALRERVAEIADDFTPDRDADAPQALAEMREALLAALAAKDGRS